MKNLLVILVLALTVITPALAEDNPYGTEGINHLGLSVSNLDQTADFFINTLGWKKAGGRPDYPAVFVTNGTLFLTLWQVENPDTATTFDRRKNVGLHHLAITVGSLDKLQALHEKLKNTPNIRIEFSPEFMGKGPTTHMMIYEPSGIRLEFVVPGSRAGK